MVEPASTPPDATVSVVHVNPIVCTAVLTATAVVFDTWMPTVLDAVAPTLELVNTACHVKLSYPGGIVYHDPVALVLPAVEVNIAMPGMRTGMMSPQCDVGVTSMVFRCSAMVSRNATDLDNSVRSIGLSASGGGDVTFSSVAMRA